MCAKPGHTLQCDGCGRSCSSTGLAPGLHGRGRRPWGAWAGCERRPGAQQQEAEQQGAEERHGVAHGARWGAARGARAPDLALGRALGQQGVENAQVALRSLRHM